jgi:hypothetical protein
MAEAHANFDNKTAFCSVEKSKPMTRIRGDRDAGGIATGYSNPHRRRKLGREKYETAMVILGEVLVVGGSALVVCSAIFWAWSAIKHGTALPHDPNQPQHAEDPAARA